MEHPAIEDLTLDICQGDFMVLCGPSGCGKSTLLRQLKTALAPHGKQKGEILFDGIDLSEVDFRTQSEKIGFVQQSPDNQIVTDKVWHELAFGLESLGMDTPTIRKKVAEMASYFGIQTWFYKNVTELSGGQKQLLNLASVMAMEPKVLILDEPTSQLDPIAASDFIAVLGKINRELGTTIVLTEHRLEDAFVYATKAVVMEKGRLIALGSPKEVGKKLKAAGHSMFLAMPSAMKIWAASGGDSECPITVAEGRNWIEERIRENNLEISNLPGWCREGEDEEEELTGVQDQDGILRLEEVWFKYEKDLPDVVRGLSCSVKKGEFMALLGGNGTGKSTSLKLAAGLIKPYRGNIYTEGSVAMLPQNPQSLFVKKTVREDLMEILRSSKLPKEERLEKAEMISSFCRLDELLDRHPYDLSGGEQQRAALAKVLLLQPDILLLDEPTKGLDAEFKEELAEILKRLTKKGIAILMVSHDIEFCAMYAHRCAMFFDGGIVTVGKPRKFFSGNSFYTTAANRMARDFASLAVTCEDVNLLLEGKGAQQLMAEETVECVAQSEDEGQEKGPWEEEKDKKGRNFRAKPAKLPLWRKLLATGFGIGILVMFVQFMGMTDLTTLITQSGLTSLAMDQVKQYGLFLVLLFGFAAATARKSTVPDYLKQTSVEKRKLTKRTMVAAALILLLIPFTLFVGVYYLQDRKYYFISLLILMETMLPFFLVFEGRKPQARELVIIAVLCGLGVAGRMAFFMLPSFKPVLALTVVAGVAFGGETGFMVGAVTMLLSNMVFSQGPWTPWQMFAMGIIGFLAGVLFKKGILRRTRVSLCIFGAMCAILIYGGIMNPASALMWVKEINKKILITYYVTGFPVDCVHAAATFLFLWFGAEPMLEKLDRIKVKYGLVE